MTVAAGSRLGPYEVLTQIGAGGMGELYRARDTRLGRDVAIKVLPPEFAADAERVRRFEQEARAANFVVGGRAMSQEVVMHKRVVSVLGLMVFAAGMPYLAQGQAAPVEAVPTPTAEANPDVNEVFFYQGRNFKGDSMTLQAPEDVPNLDRTRFGSWSERIKSLKVGTNVVVVMFGWFNYEDGCVVFRGSNAGGLTGRYPDLTKLRFNASRTRSLRIFLKTYPEEICKSIN